MRKGEIINGYLILEDFRVAGGRSKVSFARKNGRDFFIKEFLSPKYPLPDSPGSERIKERKRKDCIEFEKHHKTLNEAISRKCSFGGNLVFAVDFFRVGACYYKVTEKIDCTSLSVLDISRLSFNEILLISKTVAHSINILHDLNIVHGDLKPDNILIKKVPASYSGKLIDFDDSFFSKNPPKNREDLVGTPEYYSPEQFLYITDEDEVISGETLTCKSDIFTLGIILHEYFSGEKPIFNSRYGSLCSAVINHASVSVSSKIKSDSIRQMIKRMIQLDPDARPTIGEVFGILKNAKEDPERPKEHGPFLSDGPIDIPKEPPRITGTLVKKMEEIASKSVKKEDEGSKSLEEKKSVKSSSLRISSSLRKVSE